jgi:hypothetical protein
MPHLRFELAHDEVRELLMGEQLYGSPVYAIRELYQNALDALRFRRARLTYLKRCGQADPMDGTWAPRVVFRQGVTHEGRAYLECEDNGVGMGPRELSECFARAGKRFTTLPQFIEERARWLRCDPPVEFYPNSQFGVGVFSYFMLADELLIETCRLGIDGRPLSHLEVHISGSGSLFRVRNFGEGKQAGTKIRLYLTRTAYRRGAFLGEENEPISCTRTLFALLGIPEFSLTIEKDGKRFEWGPGQLNPRVAESWHRRQVFPSGDPDVWWCSENGVALADGIAVWDHDEWLHSYQHGWKLPLIVNFHGAHYPAVTVNRTRLVRWDVAWLDSVLEENWKSACSAPFLSLQWLLEFYELRPEVCEKIVSALWEADVDLPLGGRHKIRKKFREIGWWPGDLPLLELMGKRLDDNNLSSLSRLEPKWWITHRLRFYEALGLQIEDEVWEHLPYRPRAEPVVPEPGDEIILGDVFREEDGGERVRLDTLQLACECALHGRSVIHEITRLDRYSELGLDLPDAATRQAIGSISLTPEDLVALSHGQNGRSPYADAVSGPRLLLASAALNEPLRVLHSRLQRLVRLGVSVPDLDVQRLGSITVEQLEAKIIRIVTEWFVDPRWPGSLVSAALQTGQTLAETYRRYSKFVPLVPEPPVWDPEILEKISVGSSHGVLLSKDLNGSAPWMKDISSKHIAAAAEKLSVSTAAVRRALRKYVPLGLTLPASSARRQKWPN